MKSILLLFILLSVGCSSQPVQNNIRTQASVGAENSTFVVFNDPQGQIASLNQIKNVFLNPNQTYNAADITQKLKAVSLDPNYRMLTGTYMDQTMQALDLKDEFDWMDKYPQASRVLHNYIDPQETDVGGEPIWQTTNRNLRNSEPLTPNQQEFATGMVAALDSLPAARAIVYRGVYLKNDAFQRYKNSKEVTEKSFVSTSLDPQIGMGFSSSGKGDVATVFVIDSYSGRAISFVVPTNMHELEILIKPGKTFEVVKVIQSPDLKTANIFLKEK